MVIKPLPDYPCIELALRMDEISRWQRALKKLFASILNDNQAIDEIKNALEGNTEAFKKIKAPILKEYVASYGITINHYSLISSDRKKQKKVLLKNIDENKR